MSKTPEELLTELRTLNARHRECAAEAARLRAEYDEVARRTEQLKRRLEDATDLSIESWERVVKWLESYNAGEPEQTSPDVGNQPDDEPDGSSWERFGSFVLRPHKGPPVIVSWLPSDETFRISRCGVSTMTIWRVYCPKEHKHRAMKTPRMVAKVLAEEFSADNNRTAK